MSRARQLAKHIERTVTGPMWHGPALAEVLDGVSAERAAARPIAGAHTIWEIVLHVTAWAEIARARLQGESTGDPTPDAGLAAGRRRPTPHAWQRRARAARREPSSISRPTSRGLDDARLDAKVAGLDYSVAVLLHGIVEHGTYHGGQIALLEEDRDADRFFKSARRVPRAGSTKHHATERELWVGFYKKASGKGGLTLPGGGRRSALLRLDRRREEARRRAQLHAPLHAAHSATATGARSTRSGSTQLVEERLVAPPGARGVRAARSRRRPSKYSFERKSAAFDAAIERAFKANSGRVDVLPRAAARLPAAADVLGHERQTGRDAAAPPGHARREIGERKETAMTVTRPRSASNPPPSATCR